MRQIAFCSHWNCIHVKMINFTFLHSLFCMREKGNVIILNAAIDIFTGTSHANLLSILLFIHLHLYSIEWKTFFRISYFMMRTSRGCTCTRSQIQSRYWKGGAFLSAFKRWKTEVDDNKTSFYMANATGCVSSRNYYILNTWSDGGVNGEEWTVLMNSWKQKQKRKKKL